MVREAAFHCQANQSKKAIWLLVSSVCVCATEDNDKQMRKPKLPFSFPCYLHLIERKKGNFFLLLFVWRFLFVYGKSKKKEEKWDGCLK